MFPLRFLEWKHLKVISQQKNTHESNIILHLRGPILHQTLLSEFTIDLFGKENHMAFCTRMISTVFTSSIERSFSEKQKGGLRWSNCRLHCLGVTPKQWFNKMWLKNWCYITPLPSFFQKKFPGCQPVPSVEDGRKEYHDLGFQSGLCHVCPKNTFTPLIYI